MFTGIVQDIGEVVGVERRATGLRLKLRSEKLTALMSIDDSVAINGVCQTVVAKSGELFEVDAVAETIKKTNFGLLKSKDQVHLELAATPNTFLGGHLVQGHVNDTGDITKVVPLGENREVYIKVDHSLMRYIVKEGSVAIDGVSLTVAEVFPKRNEIMVSIIPHTASVTCLLKREKCYKFNIEVDVIAKYVENLLNYGPQKLLPTERGSDINYEWLKSKGF